MKEFVVYTLMRLALFVGALAITIGIWSLLSGDGGVPLIWAVVIAFAVSGVASYFVLNAYREKFAAVVERRASKAAAKFEELKSREDADDQ